MPDSSSLGVEQKTTESQESVDVPENFAPESQEQTGNETGNSGNIEKGNYDESEYQEYLKQLEAMQSNPLLAFNNAITSFAVSLTKPPRSNSSYPGGYYINGYFEGMKIPLPSNLGNVGIITELLIMQTRDSVQSLYASIWSVNEDLKSSVSSLNQYNVQRFNENAENRNLISNQISRIDDLSKSNTQRFNEIVTLGNRVSSLDTYNGQRAKEIQSAMTKIDELSGFNTQRAKEIAEAKNSISDLYKANSARSTEISGAIKSIGELSAFNTQRAKEIAEAKNSISDLYKANSARSTEISGAIKSIGELSAFNTQRANEIATAKNDITGLLNAMKDRVDEINALGTWKNLQLAWNTKQELDNSNQQKAIDANAGSIASVKTVNDNQQKAIDANAGSIASVKTVNDNQQKLIDANAGSIASVKTIADNHETRITKLESTDWSSLFDTASIVHAVDVVRDKVVLNTSQLKSFGDLNLQYLNDFKILLDKFYNGFSDYPDGFFWQNLRKHLSIASVLFDNKFQEGIDQLDGTLVLILKGINSIGDGINTVSGWLKLIYNKPSQIFENNESGTNFWDVLKQAISTLGDLLNGTLGNAVKALDSILGFLDSFLDKLIELIIPKNTDFMKDKLKGASLKINVKFGAVLGLADNIKNAFTPSKADFMSAISFDFMGAKFAPDRKIFDMYVPKVRAVMALMIWLEVAWYIYKRLTGSGDLINDN